MLENEAKQEETQLRAVHRCGKQLVELAIRLCIIHEKHSPEKTFTGR